jgi:lipoprotein-anchoring transpeptidase ErfK/SrfK
VVVIGATAAAAVLAVSFVAAIWSAWAWGAEIEADQRLLPGTRIVGVDVGGTTVDDAVAEARLVVDARLDRTITVTAADHAWEVTPRELGAVTDLDEVVMSAATSAASASVPELTRIRWFGGGSDLALDVSVAVDAAAVDTLVERIGDRVDVDATDASLGWDDGAVTVTADVDGYQLDRPAATTLVADAARGASDEVDLPVTVLTADVTEDIARSAAPGLQERIDEALDRPVTLVRGDTTWSVTPRDLGAGPATSALALTARTVSTSDDEAETDATAALDIDEDAVAAVVADIAATVDIAPRNAELSYSTGWVEIGDGQAGLAVDQTTVTEAALASLHGDGSSVEVTTSAVPPAVTRASYRQVLLVRQSERKVYLYEDGQIVRDWPVAVGTGGSPTPTGVFTVGAKRFEPTWVNPAPDRWGKDLPASIGPGPNNPLGLRALNWNRNGGDTLIRFHGTPNEASIGQAASNGCVRMFNSDVIELYDRVATGTTIVSIG